MSRLKRDPEVLKEYHAVIQEHLKAGIVETVEEAVAGEGGEVHYLPHHPGGTSGQATTKVRVVYDASSVRKNGGPSLNDCLYSGPPCQKSFQTS